MVDTQFRYNTKTWYAYIRARYSFLLGILVTRMSYIGGRCLHATEGYIIPNYFFCFRENLALTTMERLRFLTFEKCY